MKILADIGFKRFEFIDDIFNVNIKHCTEFFESILKETQDAENRLITTDGVFSMDGFIAHLDHIVSLAKKYGAMVHIDDSHATGFIGKTGRGSIEHCSVIGEVDIITSTLGKALGGASGGFTSGRKEIIEILRQRSRPYLFSNSLAPAIVAASIATLDMLTNSNKLIDSLNRNTSKFRDGMTEAGFDIKEGTHPIVPVMLYDAKLAQNIASDLLDEGIYVIGFSFPVVPKGQARIRVQISAAHTEEDIDTAIESFIKVSSKYKIV